MFADTIKMELIEREDGVLLVGFIWLKIRTSGGFL
jgi:hypothetical protein